jgi:hypothetical protein
VRAGHGDREGRRVRYELADQRLAEGLRIATSERRAQQLVAVSFFLLAPYIAVEAAWALVAGDRAETSIARLVLTAGTAIFEPALGVAKRRIGARLGSAATAGEGTQNLLCAYLAMAVFAGLAANTLLGAWWLDAKGTPSLRLLTLIGRNLASRRRFHTLAQHLGTAGRNQRSLAENRDPHTLQRIEQDAPPGEPGPESPCLLGRLGTVVWHGIPHLLEGQPIFPA